MESLEQKPEQGTNLGNNCYKIRIAIASKGKGKSGGARVISNFVIAEETVFLISIYDKSEKENIPSQQAATEMAWNRIEAIGKVKLPY